MHYDLSSAGYPGCWKTYELISYNYWWPGLSVYVKKYVAGCDICQWMKNYLQKPFGPLQPNKVPSEPWEIIFIDFITQLPQSEDYNAILVIINRLTKRAHFFAITNKFLALDLAVILQNRIYSLYGLPLQIISDRGVQFAAQLFQE